MKSPVVEAHRAGHGASLGSPGPSPGTSSEQIRNSHCTGMASQLWPLVMDSTGSPSSPLPGYREVALRVPALWPYCDQPRTHPDATQGLQAISQLISIQKKTRP